MNSKVIKMLIEMREAVVHEYKEEKAADFAAIVAAVLVIAVIILVI